MNPSPPESKEEEVLVCGDCGRVNSVPTAENRSTGIRCSGCGVLLRAERPRKLTVHCPACRNRLEVETEWLGHSVICGSCSEEFVAKREGGSLLPGPAHAAAPPKTAVRVGQPDPKLEDEEIYDSEGRRRKVRRARKRKKVKDKSWKEIIAFFAATLATFAIVGGVIAEVGRRSGWWLQTPVAVEEPDIYMEGGDTEEKPLPPVIESDEAKAFDQVLIGFTQAPNPEALLSLARFPSEVGERFRTYYGYKGYLADTPHDIRRVAEVVIGQNIFLRFDGKNSSGKNVTYVVERVGKGEFLVDWDSHVRYAAVPWDSFVAERDTTPRRFQLLVKRDFAGNPHFPIEDYAAFFVFWQEEADGVSLFVKRGSPEEARLLEATEPQKKLSPLEPAMAPPGFFAVTVEVFFPAEANRRGQPSALLMKRFFHDGWVDLRPGRE